MQSRLYPAEFAEDSIERHLIRHSTRSQVIYVTIVLVLLAAIASLPFLRVDVSVRSSGIIRPVTEKHEVKARTSGVVERVLARQNQAVRRGEPLLVLHAGELDNRSRLLGTKLADARREAHDLELVTGSGAALGLAGERFQHPRVRQEYTQHVNAVRENTLRQERAGREVERAAALYERALIAQTELEDRQFQLSQLRAEAALLRERQLAQWQGALATARATLEELAAQRRSVAEESAFYTVTAPVTGTLEQVAGVSAGSFVQAGEAMAVISPSSRLVADVYVSPRDIGLLRVGSPVRIQVDAFNYTDWGFATGRVTEISGDYTLVNQQPMFTVKCVLDQDHLALKNGFQGRLKKGMTLQARFFVTERSLFQLLYDDVNDWLNPAQSRE
ncbi:MAG TPA: HlyD family efflux transporter periplasmic adaptor subunit [Longimicrobiaceae bacterium]